MAKPPQKESIVSKIGDALKTVGATLRSLGVNPVPTQKEQEKYNLAARLSFLSSALKKYKQDSFPTDDGLSNVKKAFNHLQNTSTGKNPQEDYKAIYGALARMKKDLLPQHFKRIITEFAKKGTYEEAIASRFFKEHGIKVAKPKRSEKQKDVGDTALATRQNVMSPQQAMRKKQAKETRAANKQDPNPPLVPKKRGLRS